MECDVINRLREERRLRELRIKQKAAQVYATFNKDERMLVRFGMFPHDKMVQADKELIAEWTEHEGQPPDSEDLRDISRLLAVGIMDSANAGPDKMVV